MCTPFDTSVGEDDGSDDGVTVGVDVGITVSFTLGGAVCTVGWGVGGLLGRMEGA